MEYYSLGILTKEERWDVVLGWGCGHFKVSSHIQYQIKDLKG